MSSTTKSQFVCLRCGLKGERNVHSLEECPKPCVDCKKTGTLCRVRFCTSKQCKRCLATGKEYHNINQCTVICETCKRVDLQCTATVCDYNCPRCLVKGHLVADCTVACGKCNEVDGGCTNKWCVKSKRCDRCLAYGDDYHQLKQCTQPCASCGRVDSWCNYERCTAKCSRCDGNHLINNCPTPCKWCKVPKSYCTGGECRTQCKKCFKIGHVAQNCYNSRPYDGAIRSRTQTRALPLQVRPSHDFIDFPNL